MNIFFINFNPRNLSGHNIGLAYLASAVKKFHNVRVLNLSCQVNLAGKEFGLDIIRKISCFHPDIIGFSTTSFTFYPSLQIAGLIRASYPKIKFIWGGIHPTLLPEDTISHPLVDAICIGEGEKALPEYLDRLEAGQAPKVDGIWHKDSRGRVIRNRLRPFEEDLDSLSFPDWDFWDIETYFTQELYYMPGSLNFLASRGCLFDCSFCSNAAIRSSIPGRYYRTRSPNNIIAEIKYNETKYYQKGFRGIYFGDEIFGLNFDLLQELCIKFKAEGLSERLRWHCATRADVITSQWARTVAEAGCRWVWLGIESGDDYIRQVVYRKNITREDIIRATKRLKEYNINVGFYLMMGCPNESVKSMISSLRIIYETKPTSFFYMVYIPLPKTELAKSVKAEMWMRDRKLQDYWNKPRLSTGHLGYNTIHIIMWLVRILKLSMFIFKGLKLKGVKFILDLLKYSFLGLRKTGSSSLYFLTYLEQKTILKYSLEKR